MNSPDYIHPSRKFAWFQWKDDRNQNDHGISFDQAVTIFACPYKIKAGAHPPPIGAKFQQPRRAIVGEASPPVAKKNQADNPDNIWQVVYAGEEVCGVKMLVIISCHNASDAEREQYLANKQAMLDAVPK